MYDDSEISTTIKVYIFVSTELSIFISP